MSLQSEWAREILEQSTGGVAWVETEDQHGEIGIGTCFHVGDGVWVTARHVVEHRKVLSVGTPRESLAVTAGTLVGPFYHPNDGVDVAVFRAQGLDAATIELGGHLDDWFGDEFLLGPIVVIGYPPIPFSREPNLVVASGEVNAIVEGVHPSFVISVLPRGGFSGGPVLAEADGGGFVLGLVTRSLGRDGQPLELGFHAALSVEPILKALGHHGLLPRDLRELWGDLFDPGDWTAPG